MLSKPTKEASKNVESGLEHVSFSLESDAEHDDNLASDLIGKERAACFKKKKNENEKRCYSRKDSVSRAAVKSVIKPLSEVDLEAAIFDHDSCNCSRGKDEYEKKIVGGK